VLVGHSGSDDAGVYRLSDEAAMVLTVDFFTPIVDDPYDYGRVAATNSISDIYAMGGRPVVALNIAGFPEKGLPAEVLREIIRGGADVARTAGVSIVGGHTVNDPELKYGLAVVGMIDPRRIVRNGGARVGDRLVLTKPIGTGVLATALKAGVLSSESSRRLVGVMTQLNQEASALMLQHDPHAATDVTGYGLIGHANEMAEASGVSIVVRAAAVPLIEGAAEAAAQGHLTGGGKTTRAFLKDRVRVAPSVGETMTSLLFDPQTAGGLLIAVAPDQAEPLLAKLKPRHPQAAVVGECVARNDVSILVE
jgi:selenide, water dikinase